MSGNSNPSINSPASSNHELNTLVGDDAIIAANLLQEFNDCQAHHISISSTNSSVQYVPHSPAPSMPHHRQGGALPPDIPWVSCDPPPHGGRQPHRHNPSRRPQPHLDNPAT